MVEYSRFADKKSKVTHILLAVLVWTPSVWGNIAEIAWLCVCRLLSQTTPDLWGYSWGPCSNPIFCAPIYKHIYPEFTFWGYFSGIWDPTVLAPIYVPVSGFPPCHLVAKIQRHLREFCPSSDLFFFPFSLSSAIDLDVVTIVLSRVAVTFLVLTACFVKTSNSELGEKCFRLFSAWCCSSCFQ